jgi:hypothetical protein
MILWVGAGLVGLIALLAAEITHGAPEALTAAAATLIVVAGGALAKARIEFEWAATTLSRAIDDGADSDGPLAAEHEAWPNVGEIAWLTGLVCVPLAALFYIAAVWWAAT